MVDTFEFKEHKTCDIGTIGKTIKTYIVEQIMNEEVVDSSEEYSEDIGDGSNEEGS